MSWKTEDTPQWEAAVAAAPQTWATRRTPVVLMMNLLPPLRLPLYLHIVWAYRLSLFVSATQPLHQLLNFYTILG